MKVKKGFIAVIFAASLLLLAGGSGSTVWARGGGGGRGGGFGGAREGGLGGYGDRGFGDRGFENSSRMDDFGSRIDDSYYPQSHASPSESRVSNADLRAGADRTYGNMPTDGGFGRAANLRADNSVNNGATLNRITPAQMAMRGDLVRDNYRDYGAFDRGWWGDHPGCWGWGYGGWPVGWAWGGAGWPALAGYWGMAADNAPTEYDYGNNITYQNDNVYYGSQPVESTDAYYDQAQTLAQTYPLPTFQAKPNTSTKVSAAQMAKLKATPAQGKDWQPLGVFSLTQGGQSDTTTMFQLAVNKKGEVGGNYYNVLTKEAKPVHGAVDKKNMRVAWTIGTNKGVVYDTGLANLLKEQSSILVHLDKKQTQQWTLTKLQQPQKSST